MNINKGLVFVYLLLFVKWRSAKIPQGKQKEEPSIKVDSPTKDYKIEELKVTMLVKDEKSNKLQKIENNWKPEESIPKIWNDFLKNLII